MGMGRGVWDVPSLGGAERMEGGEHTQTFHLVFIIRS